MFTRLPEKKTQVDVYFESEASNQNGLVFFLTNDVRTSQSYTYGNVTGLRLVIFRVERPSL